MPWVRDCDSGGGVRGEVVWVGVVVGDWDRKPNSNNFEHLFLVSIRAIIKLRNELYISQ